MGATRQVDSKVMKSILSDELEGVESEFRCYFDERGAVFEMQGYVPKQGVYCSDLLFPNFPM